ncbi:MULTISPECIES: LexA family transcriptional regulator [Acinetobacter]|uniref:LexA family transcriptional regulator n=1 Tax=Acinetobacter TaxID=469 RepID=UPI0032B466E6
MSTLQERFALAIKHYEESKGKRFVKAHLADYCGVSRPAVSEWIDKNVQTLGQDNAEKAAKFLGVNHRWLNGLSSKMLEDVESSSSESTQQDEGVPVITWESPDDLDPNKYVIIPHVEVKFSAGNGHLAAYEPSQRDMGSAHLLSWVHKKKISPKNLMTVDIDGDSMEPNIKSGSVVMLDKSVNTLDQIQSGKVYAIRYGNELKIKRLSRRFDGALIIDSDNPQYRREIVEPDQLEHISVIGKYVSHTYDGDI